MSVRGPWGLTKVVVCVTRLILLALLRVGITDYHSFRQSWRLGYLVYRVVAIFTEGPISLFKGQLICGLKSQSQGYLRIIPIPLSPLI